MESKQSQQKRLEPNRPEEQFLIRKATKKIYVLEFRFYGKFVKFNSPS